MNYKSKLAELIDGAVAECIGYGAGRLQDDRSGVAVSAEWMENEKDIEITVYKDNVVRFVYIERDVQN